MTSDKTMITIKQEDMRKGIYIDFEGNMEMDPTMLGAFYFDLQSREPKLIQYVHELGFETAAASIEQCVYSTIEDTFRELATMAYRERRLFFAWSSREKIAISNSITNPKLKKFVLEHLVDSKTIAKKWKRKFHGEVNFPRITGQGRHRLYEYSKLINYHTPNLAKPGTTGKRLRDVRGQLRNRNNEYRNITGVAKRKWKNLLLHNEHDLKSMREVTKVAMRDLKKCHLSAAA